MNRRWWKRAAVYVGIVVVAAVLGTIAGDIYAERKAYDVRAARDAELLQYMKANIQGVEIGRPFPDLTIWTGDGSEAFALRDILPAGGVMVFLAADCQSCFDAVDAVAKGREAAGDRAKDVVIVANGETSKLEAYIADRGLALPVYRDMEQSLIRDYHVLTFPSYFCMDSNFVVTEFGATKSNPDVLRDILSG